MEKDWNSLDLLQLSLRNELQSSAELYHSNQLRHSTAFGIHPGRKHMWLAFRMSKIIRETNKRISLSGNTFIYPCAYIVIDHFFFFFLHTCRYHRSCCFANNKVGQSDSSLDRYHLPMVNREASQLKNTESGDLKRSVHSDMPKKRLNNFTNVNALAGDKLNNADVTSTAIKAKDNKLYPTDKNLFAQSKV